MIDLHTHSTASDGSDSPSELLEIAYKRGLKALALTDHDTIDGLEEGKKAADKFGIRWIPGVEIEIAWEPGEFHLLGLGIHKPAEEFIQAMKELAEQRKQRNLRMLDQMEEQGVEVRYDELEAIAQGNVIGRPHFATLLVNKKIVKNREEAFSRYLAKGRPFYAAKGALELDKAIRLIKDAGGCAILAHPLSLFVSWGRLPGIIEELKEKGLDGIEAWHPVARVAACRRLEKLGEDLHLMVTAGSDYHGSSRPERRLGMSAGKKEIDDSYMEGIPLS